MVKPGNSEMRRYTSSDGGEARKTGSHGREEATTDPR